MEQLPESIKRLLSELQSADEFARAQASFALGMLGEPAVASLIELLRHEDRDVRMRAAWALGVIGQPALPALLALAEGEDAKLRVEAIRVLGVIGEGRALNQLFHALTDPSPSVAQRAAVALGRIGDPRAYHPLLTAIHHPSPDVRYAVCNALAHLHVPDAVAALEQLAGEDESLTSWGASVADAARRASQEIAAARPHALDGSYVRVSELLRQQRDQE
jgi:HEAT repeat protein